MLERGGERLGEECGSRIRHPPPPQIAVAAV